MNPTMLFASLVLTGSMLLGGCTSLTAKTDAPDRVTAASSVIAGMEFHQGFLPFFWDEKRGKVLLLIEDPGQEFIYINYLARGIGSNDLGLDRGQLGNTRIVRFQRAGPRILLVQPNYDYRAVTSNSNERAAIEESFASSVLWSFKIEHEADGQLVVDASEFLARDAHGLAKRLRDTNEGSYSVDAERSVFYPPRSRAFERNTELEYLVTFAGQPSGRQLPSVVPTPEAITVHMHHSFVQLPDDGYSPRILDPRSGYFGISYSDYATPIEAPLTKRFIARHRLQKRSPGAPVSDAVEPIVYYVDAGAPSPIREALIDGARWWNDAFEAAGYRDAYRVEVLPEGADPLDVRYNVIQWVHRSTRGWSYGASVIDPRTGEIIKGHVSLGSLRVRQDFLLAEGLLSPYAAGGDNAESVEKLKALALARLRQLSAHEVGHTLGLNHNFAASVQDRASVMDYPHPLVTLAADGSLDISEAYAVGVGAWDKFAIEYGYQDFPETLNEKDALGDIVKASLARGQLYVVDQDARTAGAAHPLGHLWDNGSSAVDELNRLMNVRKQVLKQFSEKNIPVGEPLATLEEVLVPMYLMHRYQLEATAKLLGGQYYSYAMRGDGQTATRMLDGATQRAALDAMLSALRPEALALPNSVTSAIPGRPPGYWPHRELFDRRTGTVFDAFAPAEAAASLTVDLILEPQRANRLVNFNALMRDQPGLEYVLDRLIASSWKADRRSGQTGNLQSIVDHAVLDGMMRLAAEPQAGEVVRGKVYARLTTLATLLDRRAARNGNAEAADHYRYGALRIKRFLEDPQKHAPPPARTIPPGSPIGNAITGSMLQ
ncbi:MAG: DUF5117 domain-containing protein [Gammaproteobacteria bacterium]|nr:DUF5117 domain-containing protein [Gammaproteobacteria bacterium]